MGFNVGHAISHAGEVLRHQGEQIANTATQAFQGLAQENQNILLGVATPLAAAYKDAAANPDYDSCVLIVAAGVAAGAASIATTNPTIAAALAAGGGTAVAQIACRKAIGG
jgi:hypothetical protein